MTGLGAIVCSIGVHHAESSTEYVAFVNGAGTPHVATGVTRAVGWHEFLIYVEVPGVGNSTVRFYASEAGSTAVRTETGVAVSLPGQVGIRVNGQVASDDHGYWDDIHASYERAGTTNARHVGIVEAFGSVVLPLFQPAHVYSFDGVTITDETAGASSMELGSTSYTFRFSSDGGSSWSSPATLNNANLQALDCDGDGLDVLEITVEQTASMDSMGSPATRRIEVQYTPSIVPRIVHHRNQLAGVC